MTNLTYAQQMKNAIIADLQELVDAGILKAVIADDMSKLNPLDRTYPGYPSALVIPPTISTSDYADTANNLREYTWYIMVVTTPDNIPTTDLAYLEGLVDNVLNAFDLDCTLQGTSIGGVLPAVLEPPGPVNNGSLTYVVFYVLLKARALIPAAIK